MVTSAVLICMYENVVHKYSIDISMAWMVKDVKDFSCT